MSVRPLDDPDRLRLSFARELRAPASRERLGELAVGGGFVVLAALLAAWAPAIPAFSWPIAVGAVVVLALAGRVRFDFGAAYTAPTELVFVPMLFLLPPGAVPPLVAAGFALATLPDVARGRVPASRLLVSLGNSWFSLGPAAVFAAVSVAGPATGAIVLVPAVMAQIASDACGSVIREGVRGELSLHDVLQEMRPVYAIDVALASVGLVVALAAWGRPWAALLVLPLLGLLASFSGERRSRLDQLIELNDAYRGTALVLGDVVESDDAYTGEHCRGVVALALAVATELGLDAHERRLTEFGALLHDVGKLGVPKEIINKPGALDEREWTIIRMHTIEGQRLLDRVGGIMSEVGAIVRSSHERWDGKGYPDGLRGEAIPLEARIVSACDAYDAMTTSRPYRAAMAVAAALEELRANAGRQFDPTVVDGLLAVLEADGARAVAARAPA